MQKCFKKIVSVFLFSLVSFNFLFGMLPDSQVLTVRGEHKKVEDLDIGDLVSIYSIRYNGMEREPRRIDRVQVKKTKELVVISTAAGVSIFGPDQKVYNRRIFKFVRAKELRVGDILFSPELRNLEIEEIHIERLSERIGLYHISIEDKCLFLALMDDENHILLHNAAITLTFIAVAWGGGSAVVEYVGAKAVVAAAAGLLGYLLRKKARRRGVDVGPWSDTNVGVRGEELFGQPSMVPFSLRELNGKKNPDLEEVLEDADKVDKRKGPSEVWKKRGGRKQKSRDFDRLNKGEVEHMETPNGPIRVGRTSNGEKIIDRDFSSEVSGNGSTLEIQHGKRDYTKIRY